jgi:hypothetical protein
VSGGFSEIGINIEERDQDELPIIHSRVWNDGRRPGSHKVSVEQDVYVDGSRPLWNLPVPNPTEHVFDLVNAEKQLFRRQVCDATNNRIQETRLIDEIPRVGFVHLRLNEIRE